MQNPGTNDWASQTPNGGFNIKRPPLAKGLGPSPAAVNFLQQELGHVQLRQSIEPPIPSFNRFGPMSRFNGPPFNGRRDVEHGLSQLGGGSSFEMEELLGLSKPRFLSVCAKLSFFKED